MMAEMDQMPRETGKISVRNYIDTFMERQGKLLEIAGGDKRQEVRQTKSAAKRWIRDRTTSTHVSS